MRPEIIGIDASRACVEQKTGTEWYSRQIIDALIAIEDRPILRLYSRGGSSKFIGSGLDHVEIPRERFWTHLGLDRELARAPVDALFIPAHVIPRSHPPATVVTVHDLGYLHEGSSHTASQEFLLDVTTRWNVLRATRIIAPSEATMLDLIAEYGVRPERIDIVHHGVDSSRFRLMSPSTTSEVLGKLGIEQPYILFVSTLQPRKNLSRLISAFEAIDNPDLHLVIAGGAGWKSEPIVARLRRSVKATRIHWLGYVDDDHLPALYNGASVFVLPSLYEGFGMGILEAMACGCPVVVNSRASLSEVVARAGVAIDASSERELRDGIIFAMDHSNRQRLVAMGLARVQHFTWQHAAWQTLETIYQAFQEAAGAT